MTPGFGRRDSGIGKSRTSGYVCTPRKPFAVIQPSIAHLVSFE